MSRKKQTLVLKNSRKTCPTCGKPLHGPKGLGDGKQIRNTMKKCTDCGQRGCRYCMEQVDDRGGQWKHKRMVCALKMLFEAKKSIELRLLEDPCYEPSERERRIYYSGDSVLQLLARIQQESAK